MAIQRFDRGWGGVGIVAGREFLPATMDAFPAGDREWHHDPVSYLGLFHGVTNLHHLTHELMPQNVAFFHGRHVAIIEVDV